VKNRIKQLVTIATGCTEVHLPGGGQEHCRASQTQGKKDKEDEHNKEANKQNTTRQDECKK